MSYETDFHKILTFSSDIGLNIQNWGTPSDLLLADDNKQNKLHNLMVAILGNPPDLDCLAAKCIPIHAALIMEVGTIVGTMPALTIGSVISDSGDKWFSVTEEEVRRWRTNGVKTPHSVKLHAWLTLPTMEVIDFTLSPTYAKVQQQKNPYLKELEFGVIAKHADSVTGFSYKPVATGNDLPDKLHFPFVAIT